VSWTQTFTLGALLIAVVGAQAFWIGRALDGLRAEMYRGFDAINTRLDRLEARLDRLEAVVLRDHGERIARLEERAS
jgi:hypothetical protein